MALPRDLVGCVLRTKKMSIVMEDVHDTIYDGALRAPYESASWLTLNPKNVITIKLAVVVKIGFAKCQTLQGFL